MRRDSIARRPTEHSAADYSITHTTHCLSAVSFHGEGEYTFSNGIVYTGGFFEGMSAGQPQQLPLSVRCQAGLASALSLSLCATAPLPRCRFHGSAVLKWPGGCRFNSEWHLNSLQSASFLFADGLPYPATTPSSPASPLAWAYCTDADRRFASELQHGIVLAPLGQSRLCDGRLGSRPLPFDCYDVGDGYLDVESAAVWDWESRGVKVRDAEKVEVEWAKRKCRIGRDDRLRHGDAL